MPVYKVEAIVRKSVTPTGVHYSVKWKGYNDPKDFTWEPAENCDNCAELIKEAESNPNTAKKSAASVSARTVDLIRRHPDKGPDDNIEVGNDSSEEGHDCYEEDNEGDEEG